MKTNTPIKKTRVVELLGSSVRITDDNMVCLTDMWKASGGDSKHLAGKFLKNSKTQEFIAVLEDETGNPVLKISKGRNGNTWAHKLIAYDYAGWIDPAFKVGTYTVLDKYFAGELVADPLQELHDHLLRQRVSESIGSFHGRGLALRRKEKKQLHLEGVSLLERYQLVLLTNAES